MEQYVEQVNNNNNFMEGWYVSVIDTSTSMFRKMDAELQNFKNGARYYCTDP